MVPPDPALPPLHLGFPSDKVTREFDFITTDDLKLHGWHLEALAEPARANLVIVHDLKDYSERYLKLAHKFAQIGFQVFAYDQRGHGRSEGERNYFGRIQDPVDDLHMVIKEFKRFNNHRPWFVLGHGGGGSIVTRYAIDFQDQIDAFVLTAPLLKTLPEVNKFSMKIVKIINAVAPHTGILDLPPRKISKDLRANSDMLEDPLISHTRIPARTVMEVLQNLEYVDKNRLDIKIPFMILHGEDDKISNIKGSVDFFKNTPNIAGKHFKTYPTLYHDLWHGPRQELIENDVINWLKEITPQLLH